MAAALPACYSRDGWCQSSTIPSPIPVCDISSFRQHGGSPHRPDSGFGVVAARTSILYSLGIGASDCRTRSMHWKYLDSGIVFQISTPCLAQRSWAGPSQTVLGVASRVKGRSRWRKRCVAAERQNGLASQEARLVIWLSEQAFSKLDTPSIFQVEEPLPLRRATLPSPPLLETPPLFCRCWLRHPM